MTPTPSHGLSPAAGPSPQVRIVELFPPRLIDATTASQLAAFVDPESPRDWLAAQLAHEPRQQNAFLLIALLGGSAVGYMKLQHGRKGDARQAGVCWIRALAVDADLRRNGIGSALIRHAWSLVRPHEQLTIEVHESATELQLFLSAAGLECLPPWTRARRQVERLVYEFRSVTASAAPWLGKPRFEWPLSTA